MSDEPTPNSLSSPNALLRHSLKCAPVEITVAHGERPTILVVDDSDAVRTRVGQALLRQGVDARLLSASSGAEGLSLMAAHPVTLVLCDIEMPGIDGFKFLQLKGSRAEFADIPVIMLTIKEELKAKVMGLSQGAQDYLTKPFYDEELVARVRVHLKIKSLQDELRHKNERLEFMSRTDELTGLANRRHFMESIQAEFARAKRFESALSLVLLDVDHFKRVNDTRGHHAGDVALVNVANILRAMLRKCDFASRYGGEEFGLILPETPLGGAKVVAERCRKLVEQNTIASAEGPFRLTASLGLSSFPSDGVDTPEELIRRADAALYRAKERGRNRVCV